MAAAGLVAALLWLAGLTMLGLWRRYAFPDALAVFCSGLGIAYVLLPFVHHVAGTDGYWYITGADNFFARSKPLQLTVWLSVAAIAAMLTAARRRAARRLAARRASLESPA
jgi:hypothetical protein